MPTPGTWIRRAWFTVPIAAVAILAGCAVGPDYQRPDLSAMPATYSPATNGWKVAEPRADFPKGNWWEVFQDLELNALENSANTANQELKSALAAFDQARSFLDLARSGYFPAVSLNPSVTRQRDSANRPVNGVSNNKSETYNTFTVPLDLTYELDVWGRVRRTVEAARATLQADAADVQSVRLAIQAEVATDYFTLHALDEELALLRSNVEVFTKSLVLTQNRRAGGIATDLDVSQAETILKTTQAQLPVIALQRKKAEHALAVLVGRPAPGFVVEEKPLHLEPPILPSGLPSELLERRPDIAASERRMAAANAGVGVANAAFYPSLKLGASAGLESVSASSLFDWPSRLWSVGPSLSLPIFEGGANRARLRQAKSAYEEVVANYRQNVLQAFAQVEDNLSAQSLLAVQQEAQAAAVKSARKTVEIASNRYQAGLVTYLEVATAQNAALDLERELVRLRGDQLVTSVALIKSLGGGWEASQLPDKNSSSTKSTVKK